MAIRAVSTPYCRATAESVSIISFIGSAESPLSLFSKERLHLVQYDGRHSKTGPPSLQKEGPATIATRRPEFDQLHYSRFLSGFFYIVSACVYTKSEPSSFLRTNGAHKSKIQGDNCQRLDRVS